MEEVSSDGKTLVYLLDENGDKYGVIYNGTYYYYFFNLQGDVIGIYNSSGTIVARYVYDAWGKTIAVTDTNGNTITDPSHIANQNPIRYRGYYYDNETGFYYLQSRYYDPTVGRFINADSLFDEGAGLLGYNLFAYCANNPVNTIDPTGNAFIFLAAAICAVAGAIAGGVIAAVKGKNVLTGVVIGAAIGCAIGLTGGAIAGKLLAGSALAKTGAVIAGGKALLATAATGILTQADKVLQKVGSVYRTLTQSNFRYNLQQLTGSLGKGMQAHHIFPQKFINEFARVGININNPLFGSWVGSNHQSWSVAYNNAWQAFFKVYNNPTTQQIFNKVAELAKQYGFKLNFK